MPTMKDVARVARVSLATVSAALSGAAYVSPELKSRVHAAVDALGYAPNTIASGFKKGTMALIGLIVPDITNPFYTELVHVAQRRARQLGYSVLLCDSEEDADRERDLVRLMRAHRAAGTILCPCGADEAYADFEVRLGAMPVVTVDHAIPGGMHDRVLLDNAGAAALATQHILGFGHRRIGTVAGPEHRLPGRDRLQGFLDTLQAAGIAANPELICRGGFREADAFDAAGTLLALPKRPTALFVANNHMLIGVMRAIAAAGLSCPRDISVASIDDFPWAPAFTPALTTVRQPVEAMAEAALAMLLERVAGHAGPGRTQRFQSELVIRQSCAAPIT